MGDAMPNTYYYACDECQQYVAGADKVEKITCQYCNKPLTYHGYRDEALRYYQFIPQGMYHCFVYYDGAGNKYSYVLEDNYSYFCATNGCLYWYYNETGQWYRRGERPLEDSSTQTTTQPSRAIGVTVSTRTINYNGMSHPLALDSNIGGYHLIYSPTGRTRLVNDVSNDKILVRIPRNNEAPVPQDGFKYGCTWRNDFNINIPWIYNAHTLATDGFYIVAKIPHKFNPKNKLHFDQVKRVLTNMSAQGCGPDFRPDNVRFKENGDLALIDFSENPAVRNTGEDDFPALMKEFTKQFAACGENPNYLYNQLRSDMSDGFRKKMDNALQPWEK
jgi:hypothetical protein